MNYAASRQDIMMPVVSIVVAQSYYTLPATIFALTLFKPCVQMLGSSMILPCSANGLMTSWNFDKVEFWALEGVNVMLASLEYLLMQELVSVATLANYTVNFYGLIVLNRLLKTETR